MLGPLIPQHYVSDTYMYRLFSYKILISMFSNEYIG